MPAFLENRANISFVLCVLSAKAVVFSSHLQSMTGDSFPCLINFFEITGVFYTKIQNQDLQYFHRYQKMDSPTTSYHLFQFSKRLTKTALTDVSLPKLKFPQPLFINSQFVRASLLKKNVFTFPERCQPCGQGIFVGSWKPKRNSFVK